MLFKAFGLGFVAQSALILCGLVVFWVKTPTRVVGALGGLGAGLLLGAIAFDLVPDASVLSNWELALWMLGGAAVFVIADRLVEARFGAEGGGASLGIVIGSIVDGVPESLIFGIQIAMGLPVSVSFLVAVFISNIPQALAPSADMAASGWSRGRLVAMWAMVAVACGLASALGWGIADVVSSANGARAAALGMGGVLAMLVNSLIPFSYERGKAWAGILTVVGFLGSLIMS
jgi:zinc transporter, ZIP family